MHLNTILLLEKYAKAYFKPGISVLEIGPDSHPSTINKKYGEGIKWDTIDIFDNPNLTFKAIDEYHFPLENESYDVVISSNVIECVRKVWKWVPELARVTRKGGYVITLNPVSWPVAEDPVDCWRMYPDGMKALYEDAELKTILSVAESLESMHLYKVPFTKFKMWPGSSMAPKTWKQRLKLLVGYPVVTAIDTITIGEKC